jgi:PAS domain S-box-containing protein
LRIVHIDDDVDFANLTATVLGRAGFALPMHFASGEAAVAHFSNLKTKDVPDLVLLDLNMPGMNGIEVLRWLRQEWFPAELPIVLFTSSDDPADKDTSTEAGATGYLLKNSFKLLLLQLDQLIATRNHRRLEERARLPETLSEFARLAEETTDSVVLTDADGLIRWVNEPFLAMCGYTLEELRGQKPGRVLQGTGTDPAVVRQLHEAMRKNAPCECSLLNYRKNGQTYAVHISLGPIHQADGRLAGYLAVERELAA